MQICMIRHGSTAGNLERRYVGSTDEWLTMEAVQELAEKRREYPQPELIFISPMRRCLQTAKILYPDKKMVVLDDLRECDFGEFEYKNFEELKGDTRYQEWIDSGGTIGFPNGENRAVFVERCCAALKEAVARAVKEGCSSVGFVVHGGTIMAVLDQLSVPHRDYYDWQTGNAQGFTGTLEQTERGLRITEIKKILLSR